MGCVCVCVYVCVCIYIYIYIYVCMYVYICTYIYIYTHTHTTEYYSSIKKEILPFVATCMNLEGIMLSEVSQRKTNTI